MFIARDYSTLKAVSPRGSPLPAPRSLTGRDRWFSLKLVDLPARQSSCASVYTTAAEMLARWWAKNELVAYWPCRARRGKGAKPLRVRDSVCGYVDLHSVWPRQHS